MAGRQATELVRTVRPFVSTTPNEAARRAKTLYKAFYRYIPTMLFQYNINCKTVPECRALLRKKFDEHKDVTDIRVTDMLVVKGQMELQEIVRYHKMFTHILNYWDLSETPKQPRGFMEKFIDGH